MKRLIALVLIIINLCLLSSCVFADRVIKIPFFDREDENVTDDGNTPNTDEPEVKPDDKVEEIKRTYIDFTMNEKSLFTTYIGVVIPFIANDAYYVEGYYDTDDYEHGINFYTVGNTEDEFRAYLEKFSDYTLEDTYTDDYGDTWYCYVKNDVVVDLSYYEESGYCYVDVFVYSSLSTDPDDTTGGSGDNSGNTGSGDSGNNGGNVTNTKEDEWRNAYECITVAEALEICEQIGNNDSDVRYYIIATITSIANTKYGEMMIEDETGEIYVYGVDSADGSSDFEDISSKPAVGDVVLLYATLKNHNDTLCEVKNGWLIDFYTPGSTDSGNTGTGSGSNGSGTTTPDDTYTYNDFTSNEKALMTERLGLTIPFIPNDKYYFDEWDYSEDGYSECGINFYPCGITEEKFNAYLEMFSGYTLDGTEVDEYGDTWYYYSKGNVCIDVSYYYCELEDFTGYIIDLYAYIATEEGTDSGNTGTGSGSTGTGSGNTGTDTEVTLPEGTDGIYNVDLTKAEKVKDVTDQGYYLDGCPTTGSPAVLVIPVEFSDSTAASKGYTIDALVNAFAKNGVNDYYSVYDYYYTSSYGKLELDITVLDEWFRPQYASSYYYSQTYEYDNSEIAIGDQLILDEALKYLDADMDLSKFDSDGNNIIDAVILVNTLDIDSGEDFYWAYRYWNVYTDEEGYYYEYDGVSANDYIWAPYQFLHESYTADGDVSYDDDSVMNTYTFIHEFGHVLGADDYYDTSYEDHPMGGYDIMDSGLGDQNAYTKFNLGWITESILVVTDTSVTLTIESFTSSGDTIIIANSWDEKLGAYQEYYIIAYYTNDGLNAGDAGYFDTEGIVVYHVNAALSSEEYEGKIYYDVKNNNTSPSDEYGTEDNLIEYVTHSGGSYVYEIGDTLPSVTDDLGNTLVYTFTIDELTDTAATITFTAA